MAGVSVGLDIRGIVDYFRQGKELETFKQLRPVVYQKMTAALKPEGGGTPDFDAADAAVFDGMMEFQERGGSEEAARRLFAHMGQAVVEKKKRDLLDRQLLLNSGNYEVAGEPGNVTLQKRQPLMSRLGGGQPPTQAVPTVQQGGTLLPSQSSPSASAPMPPMPTRPPLQEETLGGTEQPAAPDWMSQTATPEGRNTLIQQLTAVAMSGSPADQKEAANAITLLSNLNKTNQKNVDVSAPQLLYDDQGNLQPLYSVTDKEKGTVNFNRPLTGLSKEDRTKRRTSAGGLYQTKSGRLVRQRDTTDYQGNTETDFEPLPPGLSQPGTQATLVDQIAKQWEQAGIPVTASVRQRIDAAVGPVAERRVKILQDQKRTLEQQAAVLQKNAQVDAVLRNGPESSSQEEKRAFSEYEKKIQAIAQIDKQLNEFTEMLTPPPSSVAPMGSASSPSAPPLQPASPGMVPLSSHPPRTPAALNWVDRELGR